MHRALLLTAFATVSVLSLAACGGSAAPAPASVPTLTPEPAVVSVPAATPEPIEAPQGDINTLLLPAEVSGIAGVDQLTTSYRDQKSGAASVDPSQVEHMDSFDSLSFDTADGAKSLVLTTIDFDSEGAATDHAGLIMGEGSGMRDIPDNIGDASAYLEANKERIGSVVVFRKGEWVVTLHTAQATGISPLVNLEQLKTLARIVADMLSGCLGGRS